MTVEPAPASAVEGGRGLRRFRAVLAYDGSRYHGWARQPGLATVEQSILDALRRILRVDPLALTCAGRTDAGVHATGQVIHFDAPWDCEHVHLARRLNAVLPPDIRVRIVEPAADGFDARFAALWRRYRYRATDGVPDPLTRHMVLSVRHRLDVAAMSDAVSVLVGRHDFGSFCRPRAGATAIRTVEECEWTRDKAGVAVLDIRAVAFCHSMVRSVVGASLAVGAGRRDAEWLDSLLRAPSRKSAAPVAPPHGLVLVDVGYPQVEGMGEQVETVLRRNRAVPRQ